jgi:hypothetical protein
MIAIQIDKFVKKVFKLLLELKKEGSTNKRTPIMYIIGTNLSI